MDPDTRNFLAHLGSGIGARCKPEPARIRTRGRPLKSEVIRDAARVARISEKVRLARIQAEKSVYQLSGEAGVGYRTVRRLELGTPPVSLPVIRLVCGVLGLDLSELMGPVGPVT